MDSNLKYGSSFYSLKTRFELGLKYFYTENYFKVFYSKMFLDDFSLSLSLVRGFYYDSNGQLKYFIKSPSDKIKISLMDSNIEPDFVSNTNSNKKSRIVFNSPSFNAGFGYGLFNRKPDLYIGLGVSIGF